jgi:thioredoxin 1
MVAIEFYLEECPACKQMAPMLEEAEQQFKGRITFFKINLDKYPQVGAAFGVQAVPSLLIVDQSKNKVLFMGTGVPPSQAEFTKMLDLVLLKSLEK